MLRRRGERDMLHPSRPENVVQETAQPGVTSGQNLGFLAKGLTFSRLHVRRKVPC